MGVPYAVKRDHINTMVHESWYVTNGLCIDNIARGETQGGGGKGGSSRPPHFLPRGGRAPPPPTLLQYMHVIHYYSIDIQS